MVQDGWTALIGAASSGHDGMVDLLVKAGAKLDVQDEVGGDEARMMVCVCVCLCACACVRACVRLCV